MLLGCDNLTNCSIDDSHVPRMPHKLRMEPENAGFGGPYPLSNPPKARPNNATGRF